VICLKKKLVVQCLEEVEALWWVDEVGSVVIGGEGTLRHWFKRLVVCIAVSPSLKSAKLTGTQQRERLSVRSGQDICLSHAWECCWAVILAS
jgi:hypothetical protein